MHCAAVDFFLNAILICRVIHRYFNFATLSKDLLHVFICSGFMLHAVHETETYFQLPQHLLLDQSPYNGLMKLMVFML